MTDEARAKADDASAKAAWSAKVGLYQTCLAMDRVVERYRREAQREGRATPAAATTPPCADPGAYAAPVTPIANKPIEASGAHSPPGNATSPPSTNNTAAELDKTKR
jgi:hypothetical protein